MKDQIFSELLASAGYEVDFAIGTTYSLSFETLLCVPISFGMLGELDDSTFNNPYYLLESIRRSSDKFAIFCNKGGIAVPANVKTVYSLLEKSIFEVSKKEDQFANFHPKIWIIKEHQIDDESKRQIKLIVMSRNLTFDTSLDIAASLTAPLFRKCISTETAQKHKPLKDMVEWLAGYAVGEKKRQILALAEDIDCLDNFEVEEPFCDYEFFPFKYGEQLNEQIDLEKAMTGRCMITVSPFIDMTTLKRINEKSKSHSNGTSVLITREDYVNQEVFDYFNERVQDAIYVVNESMLDNEVAPINLHAKCYYVSEPRDNTGSNYLYLGSANATNTAFTRNTEFLLRLQFKPYLKGIWDTVLEQFVNDEDRRFERVTEPTTGSEGVQYTALDKLLIEVSRYPFKAEAKENDNGSFSLSISCNKTHKNGSVLIAPFQLGKDSVKRMGKDVVFDNVQPEQLSELYILKVERANEKKEMESDSTVIKIKTTGIPENRDMLILQSLVNTKEKFIDYVTMMLSDNPAELVYESEREKKHKGGSNQAIKQPALYERLLRVAYEDPKQLKRIDTFVKEINKDVVGESFEKMYSKFVSIIKKLERL